MSSRYGDRSVRIGVGRPTRSRFVLTLYSTFIQLLHFPLLFTWNYQLTSLLDQISSIRQTHQLHICRCRKSLRLLNLNQNVASFTFCSTFVPLHRSPCLSQSVHLDPACSTRPSRVFLKRSTSSVKIGQLTQISSLHLQRDFISVT